MKLQLNKKHLKNLSKDSSVLPDDLTPKIGGAGEPDTDNCVTDPYFCQKGSEPCGGGLPNFTHHTCVSGFC